MIGRRYISISREGWYYLFLLTFVIGGAAFRQINLLVLLAGLMLGPLVFNWRYVAASLKRINVRRRLPRRICAGDPLIVEVIASNMSQWLGCHAMLVKDSIQLEGAPLRAYGTSVEAMIPYVAAGDSDQTTYRCELKRRGRYRFGPLKVSTRFPLGLVRASRSIDREDTLIVCPRLGHLTRRWTQLVESQQPGSQQTKHRLGHVEGEYYGLRDWHHGDSRRWIHWRTTAKLGKLAVRQFERQQGRDLFLLLDLWRPSPASLPQFHAVEISVSLLATAIVDSCRRGDRQLTVVAAGETLQQESGAAAPVFVQQLLEHLAVVKAGRADGLPNALASVIEDGPADAAMIVVSTRSQSQWATDSGLLTRDLMSSRMFERVNWINVTDEEVGQFFQWERPAFQSEQEELAEGVLQQ